MGGGRFVARNRSVLAAGVLGLVLASLVWWVLARYLPAARARALDEWRARLSAMADDRQAAVDHWLVEEMGDARTVADYPTIRQFLSGGGAAHQHLGGGANPRRHLVDLLQSVVSQQGLRSAAIVGVHGQIVVGTRGAPSSVAASNGTAAIEGRSARVEIEPRAGGGVSALMAAPVMGDRADAGPVGAVVLEDDAERFLFRLLRHEPTPTRTGETTLARREGELAVFLGPLRGSAQPPLSVRAPLDTPRLAMARALTGDTGFSETIDYRGVEVLSVTRRLSSLPWGLVVKIDRDEALAGLRRRLYWEAVGAASLLAALAALVFGLVATLRATHAAELGAARARLTQLLDYASDAILFVGPDGRIRDSNRRAAELYGAEGARLEGRHIAELRVERERPKAAAQFAEVTRRGSVVFETVHLGGGGREVPVEISANMADAESGFRVAIVRDITERKAAEARIALLNRLYRTLSEVDKMLVRAASESEVLEGVCHVLAANAELPLVWVGMRAADGSVAVAARGGPAADYAGGLVVRWDETPHGAGPTGRAILHGSPVVLRDLEFEPAYEPWRTRARAHGLRSSGAFPIPGEAGALGALNVYGAVPDAFGADEVELLQELAQDVGYALQALRQRERLRQTEEKLRALFEGSVIGILFGDIGGSIHDANDEFLRLVGYTREDLREGRLRWTEITPPEHLPADEKGVAEARARGACTPYEKEYVRQDGTRVWVLVGFVLLEPERERSVAFILDITQRRRAEALLAEAQRIAHLGGFEYDARSGRFAWSEEALRIYGLDSKDISGTPEQAWTLVHPEDRGLVEAAAREAEATGREVGFRNRIVRADGTVRTVDARILAERDAGGRVVRHVGTVFDVTERAEAEAALRRLHEDLERRVAERTELLEAANRELEAFSYSVSHDLRAPLRAIEGFTRILQEDHARQLEAEARRVLGVVRDNVQRMSQLIDDLLAFSRVGRQALSWSPVDMNALARSAFAELAVGEDAAVELRLATLPPALGDPSLLRQVWTNLLSNALKFSRRRPNRRVEVVALHESARVVYRVRDNGVGFDPRYAHKLFGVFQRLHSASEFEGTGVGLALVQRIVARHGGGVLAENQAEGGATFSFWLPAS